MSAQVSAEPEFEFLPTQWVSLCVPLRTSGACNGLGFSWVSVSNHSLLPLPSLQVTRLSGPHPSSGARVGRGVLFGLIPIVLGIILGTVSALGKPSQTE